MTEAAHTSQRKADADKSWTCKPAIILSYKGCVRFFVAAVVFFNTKSNI
jgi:hypothetical protein